MVEPKHAFTLVRGFPYCLAVDEVYKGKHLPVSSLACARKVLASPKLL
jgi:hypothetical protein